jgi:hypothetical protein
VCAQEAPIGAGLDLYSQSWLWIPGSLASLTPRNDESALAFYQRSGFQPFRRQIEIADDPRLDGTALRSAAKHVPIIE